MRTASLAFLALIAATLASPLLADDIAVAPGKDAIATALAKAKPGDTLKVAPGEYAESVTVPVDLTIEGAGADKTTITAVKGAAINCHGTQVRILGLTVKTSGDAFRGVSSDAPTRIERCRFVSVREAVALMRAPLSDVVACEFVDCSIGVRAIGGACPSVWGCVFKGGGMGVFEMDGCPYIRDNVFVRNKEGIRIVPHDMETAIIRNNVFLDCTEAAVNVLPPRSAFGGPSIRNNVIAGCPAAVIVPADLARNTTNNVYTGAKAPAVRTDKGDAVTAPGNTEADAGVAISDTFAATIAKPDLLNGKGIRLCAQPEGTAGTIGLEKEWLQAGITTTGTLPPVRFGGKMMIANAVAEEYQYLQFAGRSMSKQSSGKVDGVECDTLEPGDGKKPAKLFFDISRFFGESSLKP